MTEQNQIPPGDGDLALDKQLLGMQRLTPTIGFENRVLSRVWRPAPMFALVWKDRLVQFAKSPARWLVAGTASLGSLVATLWLANEFEPDIRNLVADASRQIDPVTWNRVQDAMASWMAAAAGYLNGIPAASLSEWTNLVTVVAVAPAIGLAGLYFTMKRSRSERVRSYAAR